MATDNKESTQDSSSGTSKKPTGYSCRYCGEGPYPTLSELGVHSKTCPKRPRKKPAKEATSKSGGTPPTSPPSPAPSPSAETSVPPLSEPSYGEEGSAEEPKPQTSELFKTPKTPEEVLKDVLKRHGLKQTFIDYATGRSKDMGGIHPNDLGKMLNDLDSGVKSKGHAQYVMDDYFAALQKAQNEARRIGHTMRYPLSIGGFTETEESSSYYPSTTYTPPSRGYPAYGQVDDYGRPVPRALSLEDVKNVVSEAIQDKRKAERLDTLEESVRGMKDEILKATKEAIEETLGDQDEDEGPPPDVMTKADLEAALTKLNLQSQLDLTRQNMQLQKESYDKMFTELKETRAQMKEDREKLLGKLEAKDKELVDAKAAQKPATDGYQSDQFRFAAGSVDRLVDLAKERQPIKIIVDGVMKPQGEKAPERVRVEEGRVDLLKALPDDIIEDAAKTEAGETKKEEPKKGA